MLKNTFINLVTHFTSNINLAHELWAEIEKNYATKKRHYHNLSHLENLLQQLLEVKEQIKSWETILFSLFYHDVIYNVLKTDNEEQSALLAEKRLKQIEVPTQLIENCKAQILATKKHGKHRDEDTNYFTDADLSILGQDCETYTAYFKNVRKEYSIYPGLVYNPGRKKVLKHFLDMERIYKTGYFYSKFEESAKKNLQSELDLL